MNINEKDHRNILDSWVMRSQEVKTTGDLVSFIKSLQEDYTHDYGTTVHAAAAVMMAAFNVYNYSPQGELTGFQSSCVMHEIIPRLSMIERPYRIVQYQDMLYPQYRYRFEKTISKKIWDDLQKVASEKLAGDTTHVAKEVLSHWKSVAEGNVPFGFTVVGE